ncbi:hypothetical protein DL89DRAFT_291792 [Linderina pennispora]|uniref:Uncharacterized protein n=1 Tax=Linderina pennispora TaxID=61395 RepID=A0A1Y1WCI8_9FUNG|nr:uncharacterized protein DL89DRAFT_291792 [Linderina pennispora]ORX71253.1 hypothetical protein DL89DRAFT_291792 [Linderina pennispora]
MTEFSSFRRTAWDPILILSQIATLQCFGYSTYSFCMVISSFLTDIALSPALLFDSTLVRGDTVQGWVIGLALVGIGLANILPFNFSLTFYTIHLALAWWYQGELPKTLLWWAAVGLSGCIMAFVGRAACLRRELLPIAIRNFMPDHPSERREADEEMEMETRVEPEVLYEADAQMDDAGSDDWGNDNWGNEDDDDVSAANVQGSRPRTNTQQAAEGAALLNPNKGDKDR